MLIVSSVAERMYVGSGVKGLSCSLVPYQGEGTNLVTQAFVHFRGIAFHKFSDRSLVSLYCASQCNRSVFGSTECSDHTQERG